MTYVHTNLLGQKAKEPEEMPDYTGLGFAWPFPDEEYAEIVAIWLEELPSGPPRELFVALLDCNGNVGQAMLRQVEVVGP